MNTLSLYAFLLSTVAAPALAVPALSQREVERSVLSSHPAMKAAWARWLAAKERVPQAAAWEDPMMGFSLEQDREMRNGIAVAETRLSQKLPLSGSTKAAERVAEAEAAKAYEDVRRVRADLLMRARTAFVAYAVSERRLALNGENRRILDDLTLATQRKMETAEAMLADALQAQTEAALLEDKRADLEKDLKIAKVNLNLLMQRPADAKLAPAAALSYQPLARSTSALVSGALASRPEVLAAERQVAVDDQKIDAAKRRRRPDPEIQVTARQFNGEGFNVQEVDFGLSFPLTFNRRKYEAAVREAEATREASAQDLRDVRQETVRLVREKYEEVRAAERRYLLMRDKVVPQAKKALQARAADFAARKASFLEYNATRLLLQNAENEMFERLAAFGTASAELQTLTQSHPLGDESAVPGKILP